MFANLTDRFSNIVKNLKGKGKITEKNIQSSLREIKRALLEADVNFKIVRNFVKEIKAKAVGEKVMKSLEPGHQVVKIVNEQLISLMGENDADFVIPDNKITKIMLVGLQGAGKTTTCAKLANYFRKKHKAKSTMVACDIYRPAAQDQLEMLGKNIDVPVYRDNQKDVVKIAKKAIRFADENFSNLMIFDTAGRLHIDEKMMDELDDLKDYLKPDYIFFVADAMTGQDAVKVAKSFNESLDISGVILTKMDGDTRGGAALSIKAITQKPIFFVTTGEKMNDLEKFYPKRMASRILGMGDVLSLIEKAEDAIDQKNAEELAEKI